MVPTLCLPSVLSSPEVTTLTNLLWIFLELLLIHLLLEKIGLLKFSSAFYFLIQWILSNCTYSQLDDKESQPAEYLLVTISVSFFCVEWYSTTWVHWYVSHLQLMNIFVVFCGFAIIRNLMMNILLASKWWNISWNILISHWVHNVFSRS